MATLFEIKQNDRLRPVRAILQREGAAIDDDLTGATVRLLCQRIDPDTLEELSPLLDLTGSVEDADEKIVRYDWAALDTATAGTYYCEFEITYSSGKKETFPTRGYYTGIIHSDLG